MSGAFTPKFPSFKLDHGLLEGLSDQDHPASAIIVNPSGNIISTNVQEALEELDNDIEDLAGSVNDAIIPKTGIDSNTDGTYTTTLTYNETTREITIAPIVGTFDVFVLGTKFTKTAETLSHTATQGNHFFYYNELGVLVHSLSPWDLLRHAPVAFVFWDAVNSRGICFEERHHAGRDVWWHRNQHTAEGTKATSGFSITGYTLSDGSVDSAVTYSIATGRLEDEDIRVDTETLVDAGPYVILKRSGASGDWTFTRNSVLPFIHSANVLQYNEFTGITWQDTNVTEDFYVNYWVFGATALPSASVSPAPGAVQQAIYSTEALAHAESVSSIAWGTIPFQEICPLYQVTMRYNASNPAAYTNTARCAILRVVRVIGTNATLSAAAQTDHGALTGLTDQDHPASAIIFTPSGNIISTDVQAAILELDTEKAALSGAAFTGSITINNVGAGNSFVVEDDTSPDSTPFVITAIGQVIIGATTPIGGSLAGLQITSDSASAPNSNILARRNSTDTVSSIWNSHKARGTLAASTIVGSGDSLGTFNFSGYDGATMQLAVSMFGAVDGAPAAGSMPGRLIIQTTPTGSITPVERMRIAQDGLVSFTNGIVNISANSASAALTITQTGAGDALRIEDSTNPDSTPTVIDQDGTLIIGHTATLTIGDTATSMQSHRTFGAGMTGSRWSANAVGPYMILGKSRGAAVGTFGIVQNGDILGNIQFAGDDGTDLVSVAASIICQVAGTPGVNDMPGRLLLQTTADGAAAPTTKLQIEPSGLAIFTDQIVSTGPTAGIGYRTGAGGTVTQATSRTTGVTLNKVSGAITLVSAAGSAAFQSFTVTNSAVAATDTITVNQKSGADLYLIHVTAVAAGSFRITFATTGGTTTESPVFNFNIIKGVAA
jgi:hypothetical protein